MLLGGLGWLRRVFKALLSFAARYPWQTACVVLAVFGAFLWHGGNVARHERDTARSDVAAMKDASRKAGELALAQRKADEQHYKEIADNADHQHDAELADARSATQLYVSAHRVRVPAAQGPGGGSAAKAEGGDSGVPAESPAEALMVAVSEADVNTCAADYAFAKAAHDWAMSLGEDK
jgi:hypothetical protein